MYRVNVKGRVKKIGILALKVELTRLENYGRYFCEKMSEELDSFMIICSEKSSNIVKENLQKYGKVELLDFDGKSYISEIFKDILMKLLEQNELKEYEELVLMSDTLYGPIYPVNVMFQEMDRRNTLLWGIFKHSGMMEFNRTTPQFLDEQFVVIKKELFLSAAFKNFLFANENIGSYMEKQGYSWETYVNYSCFGVENFENYYAHNVYEYSLLKDVHVPFIEREIFNFGGETQAYFGKAEQPELALEYIKQETNYNVEFIWDDILKNNNLRNIYETLHLNRIVDKNCLEGKKKSGAKIALFLHLFYEDLFEVCISYIANMPKDADVYITINTEEKKKKVINLVKNMSLQCSVNVIIVLDRGRELGALLVACRKYLMKYDYVCHVQDKRSSHIHRPVAESHMRNFFESTIASKIYVENILLLFEREAHLGCLIPNQLVLGGMGKVDIFFGEWAADFDNTKKLLQKIGTRIPVSQELQPFVFGTVGWFRTKAVEPIFTYQWKYEDFEEEPLELDGCTAHAIERAVPYIAQGQGYYTATIMEKQDAQRQMSGFELLYRNRWYASDVAEKILVRRLRLFAEKYQKIVLYGAGRIAGKLSECMEKNGILFAYYIVKSMNGNPEKLNGHKVMVLDESLKELSGAGWVIAVGSAYEKEILDDLGKRGIKDVFLL